MIPIINLSFNEGIAIFVQVSIFAILYFIYNTFIDKKNTLLVIYSIILIVLWLFIISITNEISSFLYFELPVKKCSLIY